MTARIYVCRGCGLGRLHPLPMPGEIAGFYPPEYYGETGKKFEPLVEALVRLVAERHARFLCRGLKRGDRVLDVGCGRGVLLRAFAERGFEVHGFEMNERAAQGVDPRACIRIGSYVADAGYDEGYFDRVVLWHVLEHLPNPRETLGELHRILRPGGRLIVAVPNFSSLQARWAKAAWFHLDPPRHLFHFPCAALWKLLGDCGFHCLSQHHFSLRQNPFGWVQSALNRSRKLPRNGMYVLLHRQSHADSSAFDRRMRFRLRLAYAVGMPVGLLLSMLAAAARSGATVHVVAEAH